MTSRSEYLPNHVAIIMDGMAVGQGKRLGEDRRPSGRAGRVRELVEHCVKVGWSS